MAEQQPIDDALLGKFLAGDTNPVESARVREWLIYHNAGISEPTYDDVVEFERVWEAAQLSQFLQQPDKFRDTYFGAYGQPAAYTEEPTTVSYRRGPLKGTEETETSQLFNRITAILALFLSFGWLLYQFWYMGHDHPAIHSVTLVTGNHRLHKTLPDGTRIWLNRQSTLTYPTDFSDNQRAIKLRGEAYFDVKPDADHPFHIQASSTVVQVTGAALTVKAYEGDVMVVVHKGDAHFSTEHQALRVRQHQPVLYDASKDTIRSIKPLSDNEFAYSINELY